MDFCEDSPVIQADGRLLWRVLDNLMGNICKYALSGTRVYLTTAEAGDGASHGQEHLALSAQHLRAEADGALRPGGQLPLHRGSGLGLSIAKDLVQLQGGELKLYLDGDLFKVTIEFKMK